VHDPTELHWLDPPPAGAVAQARELLCELQAIDASGAITAHGTSIAALGTHPRLAHMLLRARDRERGSVAADLAAILEERDFILGAPIEREPDIRTRIGLLHGERSAHMIDRAALQRTRSAAQRWHERTAARAGASSFDGVGETLAFAYPDRVAQRRPGPAARYVLRNGVGAALPPGSELHNEQFLVVAQLDGRLPESLILLAAPIARDDIEREFADQIERHDSVSWSETAQAVLARRTRTLGSITLSDEPLAEPNPDEVQRVVRKAIAASTYRLLHWTKEAATLRQRLAFLHAQDGSWPDVSDAALGVTVDSWLTPRLAGRRRLAQIQQIPGWICSHGSNALRSTSLHPLTSRCRPAHEFRSTTARNAHQCSPCVCRKSSASRKHRPYSAGEFA
jgi:ATP-dependent helicase HrpB